MLCEQEILLPMQFNLRPTPIFLHPMQFDRFSRGEKPTKKKGDGGREIG